MRAGRLGFDVPATLITNNPVELTAFAAAHDEIVCKSLKRPQVPAPTSNGVERMLYTRSLDASLLSDLTGFGPEPYLFQERVAKRFDVRVTVVGSRVFACRISSQEVAAGAVDWRQADTDALQHDATELDPSVNQACIELTSSYGLRFAAIDLALRPDGGCTFFELNPNGQWAWVEQLTGLPIAAALADELLGH